MRQMKFDVEHTLSMYADDFCYLTASQIYNQNIPDKILEIISRCHVYLIGLVPKIDISAVNQIGQTMFTEFQYLGDTHQVGTPLQDGYKLSKIDQEWVVEDIDGSLFAPDKWELLLELVKTTGFIDFDVQYIGQAYGKDGNRNALDRLRKHETLQRIAVEGVPDTHQLGILMLSIQAGNQLITLFSPNAEDKSQGEQRISAGIEKMENTPERERITLYEASLIRHFQPTFNKEFKNSFPSTNLKVLGDCYEKDFAGVSAEICFENFPFQFKSQKIKSTQFVIVQHNLHEEEGRKMFYGLD